MKRAILHILILLLVFSLALTGCTGKTPPEDPPAPPPPVAPANTELTAGERAAARLQQSESGLMADGLRVPLPPPPTLEE